MRRWAWRPCASFRGTRWLAPPGRVSWWSRWPPHCPPVGRSASSARPQAPSWTWWGRALPEGSVSRSSSLRRRSRPKASGRPRMTWPSASFRCCASAATLSVGSGSRGGAGVGRRAHRRPGGGPVSLSPKALLPIAAQRADQRCQLDPAPRQRLGVAARQRVVQVFATGYVASLDPISSRSPVTASCSSGRFSCRTRQISALFRPA